MENRDGVVLMYTASPGGTVNGPGNLILLGREEQEYQMDMQRGRLQRLLSTTIFVCFFILFLDGTNRGQRLAKKPSSHTNTQWPYTDNDTERLAQIQYFKHLLALEADHIQPLGHMNKSENVSGIYSGQWAPLGVDDFKAQAAANEVGRIVHPKVHPNSAFEGNVNPFGTDVASFSPGGVFWLVLTTKPTPVAEMNTDVAYVTGQVIMHDKQSTLAITMFNVQGVFLRKVGRLTLYGNVPEARVELVYPTQYPPTASTTIVVSNGTLRNDSAAIEDEQMHFEVSPPRYSMYSGQQQRLRTGQSLVDQCSYTLDMNVHPATGSVAPMAHEHSVAALSGVVGSDGCALYWSANVTYVGENFDVFFSKASHYAILMALLAMFQIYLLLRQLQLSSTQAMAAKVSLLTIGAQAIVDSYLCLAHLTIGIVAQQIFTLFATVSFFELIIFSIFEMRYLLVIWKARRPHNFTQGWLLMRRELTTLYSRFYISLLTGLCLIYYAWHYLNFLVVIAFSFWVPQIVHNAHREVRNPFDLVYILGMSASRLFLPLYFYGCPKNFLSALPVYQLQVQPEMCYVLVGWVGVQIAVLLLQQRCGPRFFVPARFLPVKYNYERRINADQMSLLRANHGDEIDCVICMVELDMDARDYMIAPCDHIFHRPCLQEWMQVKMECPTCRCSLPEP
ncbi:hypothetical protein ACHHYP_05127 [Achlya hypogyna]|uniref:RING-type E3 ubiquitin transferase n=1 Tax=Achlya hypogyna TaxID=1202772 RepID=A0A1V9YYX6_ACHHY|nr:hypothetical protein ACHHYP_05127 [Achlya hypogyna]